MSTKGARVVRMLRAISMNHLSRIASHCPNTTLTCRPTSSCHLVLDRQADITQIQLQDQLKRAGQKKYQQIIDSCLHQQAMVGLEKHQSVDGLEHMSVSTFTVISLDPRSISRSESHFDRLL